MKSILLSIKPKWVAKILNGEKTIEVRKKFPKDYKGWVYIYCTKVGILDKIKGIWRFIKGKNNNHNYGYQGKVVACFYCNNVEDFGRKYAFAYKDDHFYEILEKSCMDTEELGKYYQPKRSDWENGKVHLYAIHISNLEIFDKPKELEEFRTVCPRPHRDCKGCKFLKIVKDEIPCHRPFFLTKAPQNYQFIEVEE